MKKNLVYELTNERLSQTYKHTKTHSKKTNTQRHTQKKKHTNTHSKKETNTQRHTQKTNTQIHTQKRNKLTKTHSKKETYNYDRKRKQLQPCIIWKSFIKGCQITEEKLQPLSWRPLTASRIQQ